MTELQTYSSIKHICAQLIIFLIIWSCFCREKAARVYFSKTFHNVTEERSDSTRQHFLGAPQNFTMSIFIYFFRKAIVCSGCKMTQGHFIQQEC